MGGGLYDPAFSALGRLYGEDARSAITQVTLFGGFASTVCWPLTAFLATHQGWLGAYLTDAGILTAVVLPLYLLGLRRFQAFDGIDRFRGTAVPQQPLDPVQRGRCSVREPPAGNISGRSYQLDHNPPNLWTDPL
jgi:hypothetical protein